MALHEDFPKFFHAIFNPDTRWFPIDEALREFFCPEGVIT